MCCLEYYLGVLLAALGCSRGAGRAGAALRRGDPVLRSPGWGTAGPECARCTGGQEGCADGGWRAGPSEGVTAGYARQEAGDGGRLARGGGICDGHSVCKGMR